MAAKFRQYTDGELVIPDMERFVAKCCKCGVEHTYFFDVQQRTESPLPGHFRLKKPRNHDSLQVTFRIWHGGRKKNGR